MAEKPILMHARSVRNTLAGRKTQTRRVIKPQPPELPANMTHAFAERGVLQASITGERIKCPYGARGDTLWVRETWRP